MQAPRPGQKKLRRQSSAVSHAVDLVDGICAQYPGCVVARHVPAGLFRSEDRGAAWQSCELLCNLLKRKKSGAFFVNSELCMTRSRHGGSTFDVLRNSLPADSAEDLVYRHAAGYDNGVIAFGSTTGNLFVRFDRGESFTAVSNYLPLVARTTRANRSSVSTGCCRWSSTHASLYMA